MDGVHSETSRDRREDFSVCGTYRKDDWRKGNGGGRGADATISKISPNSILFLTMNQ